jgi:hypothetical protein
MKNLSLYPSRADALQRTAVRNASGTDISELHESTICESEPAAHLARRCWKQVRNLVARSLLGIALLSFLLVPSVAHAEPLTTLELVVAGTTLVGNLVGVTGSLVQIFGAAGIGSQSDDHPLYTQGLSSPSLIESCLNNGKTHRCHGSVDA